MRELLLGSPRAPRAWSVVEHYTTPVAKDRAPKRFREYVDAFYSVYNRSKTSDPAELDGVLQKYSGKEGQLVYQLYRKYPQSIEIISRNGQDQRTWKTYLEPASGDEL